MKPSTTAESTARKSRSVSNGSPRAALMRIEAESDQQEHQSGRRQRSGDAARPAESTDASGGELITLNISPQEGMRYYTAILGREPTLDPEAPDLLAGGNENEDELRSWTHDLSRILREEIARTLQLKLNRRPTWRELMEAMTQAAGRRIDEARRRFRRKDAA